MKPLFSLSIEDYVEFFSGITPKGLIIKVTLVLRSVNRDESVLLLLSIISLYNLPSSLS